ncbi:MAG: electron transfer flavoprotein subunit alpha/FixB family protein [Deltaproteobacteria bacterium]|nr:electron transfer flavoprotein subunit alpha/FixB family protein [Deltaproteobacteria bacterium]
MSDRRNVLVYAETGDGELLGTTKELLGGGRQIAEELEGELIAVFLGSGVTEVAREAVVFGADRVLVVDGPEFAQYRTDLHTLALTKIVEAERPWVVLIGHTDRGADLGPRLAFRLDTAVVTDCVDLRVEPDTGALLSTKPVHGGLAMATFTSDRAPHLVTVRPKSLPPAERSGAVDATVTPFPLDLDGAPSRMKVVERVRQETDGVKIEDAEVVVSGGRGIGDAESFKMLEEVARFLKGAVGASRVAVDNGWAPSTIQVGITGKIVAPRVYLAVGISGASQHITGCSRSKTMIAINKDPAAAIFKYARYGVVGDWRTVLPAFLAKLKELE